MLEFEVLILEFGAVDALATSAISLGEVSTLTHEVLDHAVECRALITKAFLASREGAEILSGLREESAAVV
jgi:hypothetical protein